LCIAQKWIEFSANPGVLGNGCLIFWKLALPNLIPELVRRPTDSLKTVCEQHFSQNSDLIVHRGRTRGPDWCIERANVSGG
jgi:hypothetical protein